MNMLARWLESMGQDPRTFLKDAAVFFVRYCVIIFVVFLPLNALMHLLRPAAPLAPANPMKAPLPSDVGLISMALGIYLFCAVATINAVMSGWRKLAGRFPAPQNFAEGQLFKWQSGSVGVSGYSKVLFIRVSAQGLYLACVFPFRLMHPPMLIPWSQVKAIRQKKFWPRVMSSLTIGSPKLATVALENQKVIEAARQWLPQIDR